MRVPFRSFYKHLCSQQLSTYCRVSLVSVMYLVFLLLENKSEKLQYDCSLEMSYALWHPFKVYYKHRLTHFLIFILLSLFIYIVLWDAMLNCPLGVWMSVWMMPHNGWIPNLMQRSQDYLPIHHDPGQVKINERCMFLLDLHPWFHYATGTYDAFSIKDPLLLMKNTAVLMDIAVPLIRDASR